MDTKLKGFLKIADELSALSSSSLEVINKRQDRSFVLKMHLGFGYKMLSTFLSLVEDAKNDRAEAVHHLKTLVESYIYVRWIGQDDKRARLVYAKIFKEKIKFFEENPGYLKKGELDIWKNTFTELKKDIESDWKSFNEKYKRVQKFAGDCGLESVYQRFYRLACEPAHISDLLEFIPSDSLSIGRHRTSAYWAFVALDYGSFVLISALSDCDNLYELHKAEEIRIVKEEYEFTRMQ